MKARRAGTDPPSLSKTTPSLAGPTSPRSESLRSSAPTQQPMATGSLSTDPGTARWRLAQELLWQQLKKTYAILRHGGNDMRNLSIVAVFAVLTVLSAATARAADTKLGKIFIKAATSEVNGQQFPDAALEENVNDMKKTPRKFILAGNESEADFLLIVVERKAVAVSGQPASKTILATLSVRDGAAWKPATKLQSGVRNIFWRIAAEDVIKQAENWVKANTGK